MPGPAAPAGPGLTHTHEHLLIDMGACLGTPAGATGRARAHAPPATERRGGMRRRIFTGVPDMRLFPEPEAAAGPGGFRIAAGGAASDATSMGMARDPLALARVSRAAGVPVVMGPGCCVPPSCPPGLADEPGERAAASIVAGLTDGVGDTGVRAGVMGEVGSLWPACDATLKALRAGARAGAATGAAIIIHPGLHPGSPRT